MAIIDWKMGYSILHQWEFPNGLQKLAQVDHIGVINLDAMKTFTVPRTSIATIIAEAGPFGYPSSN